MENLLNYVRLRRDIDFSVRPFNEVDMLVCADLSYVDWDGIMAKGRDKNLIELRDEALCRRYYYWTEVQRLRFDDALKVLSQQEFFISEERIMSIIRRKCRELKDLEVKPVPKVKKPRLTAVQLSLFTGE